MLEITHSDSCALHFAIRLSFGFQPDSLCDNDERQYRTGLKSKYDGGISDAAVKQYAPKEESDFTKWNRTLPPNDSWMATGAPYSGMKIVLLSNLI